MSAGPTQTNQKSTVARHRTAKSRNALSRPLQLARDAGLLPKDWSVFDYGCGRGDDLRHLAAEGVRASGWDPVHRPAGAVVSADLVNLGYVINVVEDPSERTETLAKAWALTKRALIVSAMVTVDVNAKAVPYGDGVLTSRGTFQRYYHQQELELYIREVLGENPIALGVGIFAVVRDAGLASALLARKFRHRPRKMSAEDAAKLFEANKDALDPLVQFTEERGRWPRGVEREQFVDIADRFGGLSRAQALLEKILPPEFWERAAAVCRADLLVYLALSKFGGRQRLSNLDISIREDIQVFFDGYAKALKVADDLLFSLGDLARLRRAAGESTVGKVLPDSIYIHETAVSYLPTALRLYEGCARRYLGSVESADLIKLSLKRPVVSYLSYPGFDRSGHPKLEQSLRVDLQTFQVRLIDYKKRENPPILHRKELFVAPDYPCFAKFERLTKQEEKAGLYENGLSSIGTQMGWDECLRESGFIVRGHRLARRG